jgi:hypothetical protein
MVAGVLSASMAQQVLCACHSQKFDQASPHFTYLFHESGDGLGMRLSTTSHHVHVHNTVWGFAAAVHGIH